VRTSPPIERLVAALRRLPGIGEKSAARLSFHLLSASDAQVAELADAIARLKKEIVLGGALSPIDGIGPEELRAAELEARVGRGGVREVILATNPTAEGDATAHYLAERLHPSGVRVTRIACGMPLGGDLEYADHVTVGRSLENRRELG